MNDYLFVYGSLRSTIDRARLPQAARHAAEALYAAATLVGRASAPGCLHAVSWYPAFTPDDRGQTTGELWRLNAADSTLTALDAYEGEEYRRELLDVRLDNGSVLSAWVYVYDAPINDAPQIDSGDYAHWIAQQTP